MKKRSNIVVMVLGIVILCMCSGIIFAQPAGDGQEEKVLNFIKEINPAVAEQLTRMRSIDPVEYQQMFMNFVNKYREFKKIEAMHPEQAKKIIEAAKLEGEAGVLGNQYKQSASLQEKEELRKRIKDLLNQAMETKIGLEEARIVQIENDLKVLKDKTVQRKQNKDKIIEKKISELTSDEEYLRW